MRTIRLVLLSLIGAGTLTSAAAQGDWPCFRGGPTLTGVSTSTLSAGPRRLWRYETGSQVESTAAIVGDSVYVGTRTKALLCIGLSSGKLRWKYLASDAISAAPCVAGGLVFVGDEGGVFHAVNATTGKLAWKFKTEDKILSSATVTGEGVMFGSYDNYLYKLRRSDGRKLWSFKSDAQVHCTPCFTGTNVIIAGCDGKVRTIDAASGQQRAAAELGFNFGASAAYSQGAAFVGSMTGEYASVRVSDGKVLWQVTAKRNDGATYGSPAVSGDLVVFPSRNHNVFCLQRQTGKTRWVFTARDQVDSSPVIVAGRVYFGCDDGNLYGLELESGRKVWQFAAGARIAASPAVGRGRMVIGTMDGAVYCFG
jgi:outer membrane protein assembly factor BamB